MDSAMDSAIDSSSEMSDVPMDSHRKSPCFSRDAERYAKVSKEMVNEDWNASFADLSGDESEALKNAIDNGACVFEASV